LLLVFVNEEPNAPAFPNVAVGLFAAPNIPAPVVVPPPKEDVVFEEPNPPKPPPEVAVLPPNALPLVVVVPPKGFAPNALLPVLPNPKDDISLCSFDEL
jgi:hypothetical protein